ncbi:MAG: hypothetical protein CMO80_14545 [Verrucomicrobiales bacterium]|nr:hypothetical protein [Verrucomicrobiales bacterium]
MVAYLDEACSRRRSEKSEWNRADIFAAVKKSAVLRLRPKLMTVITVIASLLPILLTTRMGVEVMQPIAVPIVGGMLSSLVHVLIVTPVLFAWMRARQLKRATKQ